MKSNFYEVLLKLLGLIEQLPTRSRVRLIERILVIGLFLGFAFVWLTVSYYLVL